MSDRVVINVSGETFETREETLNRFPDTLLGNPSKRRQYYNTKVNEYFFNRHRVAFESILFYYQSNGRLILPECVPYRVFSDEVEFFQLGDKALESVASCLPLKPTRGSGLPRGVLQKKIWTLFERPDTSTLAKIIAVFSVFMIVLSVFISCIETLPSLREKVCKRSACSENASPTAKYGNESSQPKCSDAESSTSAEDGTESCTDRSLEIFIVIETVCYAWFLFEYIVRFCAAPDRIYFVTALTNVIDLMAICPFFLILMVGDNQLVSLAVLRITRLIRVVRVFKLTRYSRGLRVLGFTIQASLKELHMVALLMLMITVLASSAVYYSDLSYSTSHFSSIPDAIWWSLVTVTTVGYGDYFPRSPLGKLVGGICAVLGALAFSLPVMALATNFNAYLKCEPVLKKDSEPPEGNLARRMFRSVRRKMTQASNYRI